jgi:hypothetical protein
MKKFLSYLINRYFTLEDITAILYMRITKQKRIRLDEKHRSTLSYHFFGLVKELKVLKKNNLIE